MQFINHNAGLLSKLLLIAYARRELESWPLTHFTYEARKYIYTYSGIRKKTLSNLFFGFFFFFSQNSQTYSNNLSSIVLL